MSSYGFTDVAGEHWMVLGPGGMSFATDPSEAFLVDGRNNADSFAAWVRNEHHAHLRAVMLADEEDGCASGIGRCCDLIRSPRCRCGNRLPYQENDETPFEFCSRSCKQAAK